MVLAIGFLTKKSKKWLERSNLKSSFVIPGFMITVFMRCSGLSKIYQQKCQGKGKQTMTLNQKLATELIDQLGEPATFHQNFHENFSDWLPFCWRGFTQTTRYTYVLQDISNPATLWNNLRSNCRRDLRLAKKNGITIKKDMD